MVGKYLLFILADIVFGYMLQAMGCAICLFTVTNQSIKSRKFWITTSIFAAIAISIRMAYNLKLIDFGFHTIIIWAIFILIAIGYNKLPAMRSICSILLGGVIISATEVLTAIVLITAMGDQEFTQMMNNTKTLEGMTIKSASGVPANILFVVIVLVFYFVKKAIKKRTQPSEQVLAEVSGT